MLSRFRKTARSIQASEAFQASYSFGSRDLRKAYTIQEHDIASQRYLNTPLLGLFEHRITSKRRYRPCILVSRYHLMMDTWCSGHLTAWTSHHPHCYVTKGCHVEQSFIQKLGSLDRDNEGLSRVCYGLSEEFNNFNIPNRLSIHTLDLIRRQLSFVSISA